MALPASGNPISMSQVNVELGFASTTQISMNDAVVRTLFGVASGAISMSNGHGKSNFSLGSAYQGGYYAGTWNGYKLIIAPRSASPFSSWQSTSIFLGATSFDDGYYNSRSVIGGNSSGVSSCNAYTGGGYSDWYAPAINEMTSGMHPNTSTFNVNNPNESFSGLTSTWHSSTEVNSDYMYYYGLSNSALSAFKSNGMYWRITRRVL